MSLSLHRETDWSRIIVSINPTALNFDRFCSHNLQTMSENCFSFGGCPPDPYRGFPLAPLGGLPSQVPQTRWGTSPNENFWRRSSRIFLIVAKK